MSRMLSCSLSIITHKYSSTWRAKCKKANSCHSDVSMTSWQNCYPLSNYDSHNREFEQWNLAASLSTLPLQVVLVSKHTRFSGKAKFALNILSHKSTQPRIKSYKIVELLQCLHWSSPTLIHLIRATSMTDELFLLPRGADAKIITEFKFGKKLPNS